MDRLERWYRPGLLCIGDAAHAMSPVGGVGVNYAIQDAVAAANLLAAKLRQAMYRWRNCVRSSGVESGRCDLCKTCRGYRPPPFPHSSNIPALLRNDFSRLSQTCRFSSASWDA